MRPARRLVVRSPGGPDLTQRQFGRIFLGVDCAIVEGIEGTLSLDIPDQMISPSCPASRRCSAYNIECWEMGSLLDQCRILSIPCFTDQRGTLSAIDGPPILPFQPKRFYYLYELPAGAHRGCHAHKTEEELIIALAGAFKVVVNDGYSTKEFELKSPDRGVYVPPLVWHEVHGFTPGTVCAVVASERYNPHDYYYSYEEFLHALREHAF